ncbi:O-antigen ligase [Bacillus sp. E214]|uniref:O-antigen ligase family protein n=1 Tax=Bacillus sp. E214 TaxID=2587156 RepID=UPI0011DF552E|nr:O-antigen ligase family protein [Bacillus sp. E214]
MKKSKLNSLVVITRLFIILMITVSFGISEINESTLFSLISLLLILILILTQDCIEDFYLFLVLIPFSALISINDRGVLFIFLGIAIIKLLQKDTRVTVIYVLSSLILLILETINDLFFVSIGNFLNIFMMLLYFICFIGFVDLKKYNHFKAVNYFTLSVLVVIIVTSIDSGGLFAGLEINDNISESRFGEQTRNLGGAMGIPVYCLLLITMHISYLLNNPNFRYKQYSYLIILASFIVGFLSISRIYLVGLTVILILLLMYSFKKPKSIFMFILIVGIMSFIFIINNEEIVVRVLDLFQERIEPGGGSNEHYDVRFKIYEDSFKYLLEHPKALMFGLGINNYAQIGLQEGYLFSAWAHNLYIDAILSFGFIGSIFIIIILWSFYSKCKIYRGNPQVNISKLIPALTLGTIFLTEGSLNEFKIYIIILLLILHVFFVERHSKNSPILNVNRKPNK